VKIILIMLMIFSGYSYAEEKIVILQSDPILGIQYHKQRWIISNDKICPIDRYGNREYHKPCLILKRK